MFVSILQYGDNLSRMTSVPEPREDAGISADSGWFMLLTFLELGSAE